jgi:serine/threonine protein kinase
MLCGRLPFEDEHVPALFRKITGGYFVLPRPRCVLNAICPAIVILSPLHSHCGTTLNLVPTEGIYHIPSYLSREAQDLIRGMLAVDPVKRLTVPEVLAVPWVAVGMPRSLQPKRPVTPGMGTLHPAYPHHPGIIGRGASVGGTTNGSTPFPSNGNTPAVSSPGSEHSSRNGHANQNGGATPATPASLVTSPVIDTSSTHMLGTLASLVIGNGTTTGNGSSQVTPIGGIASLRYIKGLGKVDENIVSELAERCGVPSDEIKMALLREDDNAVKVAYMLAKDSTRVGCKATIFSFFEHCKLIN